MKKILLVANPVSGKLKAKDAVFDALKVFCKAGIEVRTVLTQYRGHGTELAKDAWKEGFDAIVCCGGDGTLNEAISGLMQSEKQLPLGYIPCGSTNDFAYSLGLSSDYEEIAKTIVKGKAKTIDIGAFGPDKNFSYIASFGAFCDASYSAPQEVKNAIGHLAYIFEGIKDVVNIKPIEMTVEIDGKETVSGKYIFGAVCNTKSAGGILHFKNKDIDLDDGVYEMILVKATGIENYKVSNAKFTFKGKVDWTLDGEKATADGEVEIKNIHSAVSLFR